MPNLGYFNCSYNQLTTLFIKNGSNEQSGLIFSNNPNLQYICADQTQFSDVQNKIAQYGYTNCTFDSYCSDSPGSTFYTIQGNTRYDANNNGCELSDASIPNLKLFIDPGCAGFV